MAKDWKPIQAEICRYYAEGRSLREVREILWTERNFHASIRAYRLKLSEWQAKRPKKVCKGLPLARPQQQSGSRKTGERVGFSLISDDEEDPSPTTRKEGHFNAGSTARAGSHERSDLSCACSCQTDKLEQQLQQLLTFWDDTPKTFLQVPALRNHFCNGVDNVLHHATRDHAVPHKFFACMLDYLSAVNNVDASDCDGMTALEIAVRMSDLEGVKALLSAGASYELCSIPNETVLHVSMLHCPSHEVTGELLKRVICKHGVDTGQCYRDVRTQAMELALGPISSSHELQRLNDSYRMIDLILQFDKRLQKEMRLSSAGVDQAFKIVVETWERNKLLLSASVMKDVAKPCCELLLQRGADIFQEASTDRSLASYPMHANSTSTCSRCITLANMVMFHQTDNELALTMARNHAEQYSEALVQRIITPCLSRIAMVDGEQLTARLGCISGRHYRDKLVTLLLFTLQAADSSLKYDFVQTMLSSFPGSRDALASSSEAEAWQVLAALCQVEESFRWPISELILNQDLGIWFLQVGGAEPPPLSSRQTSDRLFASATTYVDYLWRSAREYCRHRKIRRTDILSGVVPELPSPGGGFMWRQEETQGIATELQRCVIHVLSKTMLDSRRSLGKGLSEKTRTLWALQLRRHAGLPDIPVDSSLLINLLS